MKMPVKLRAGRGDRVQRRQAGAVQRDDGHAGTAVTKCCSAPPTFGQHKDIVLILGGTPVELICPASDGFILKPDALRAAITPKTRWIMLNLPSNPAGAVYSDNDLRALGQVLDDHPDVLILSDEIYEHILLTGASFCPLRRQTRN